MERTMVIKLGDNIVSPLGRTSRENYEALMAGRHALRQYTLPDGSRYTASLFPDEERADSDGMTFFERLCIESATDAIARAGIDPASPGVRFILATTKGNVHLLNEADGERSLLGHSAKVLRTHFCNPNPAVVVSNACVSGVSAQIVAMRMLVAGVCDAVVVVGCEVQSHFIASGFQCLHALSPDPCRPFDRDRCGLNLGEAAATIVYGATNDPQDDQWVLYYGTTFNDANHISGPSRTAEGAYITLRELAVNPIDLAFISLHGTSTLYNDEMESIALERDEQLEVPVFSLKGTYGHTMGAAGVLETVLSMEAVEHGVVYGTRGFEHLGVSRPVNISADHRTTDRRAFVKLMSGFGGCNGAIHLSKGRPYEGIVAPPIVGLYVPGYIQSLSLTPDSLSFNGYRETFNVQGADLIDQLYRSRIGNYPKYYKMDPLARLGFVVSELLIQFCGRKPYNVLFFNRSASRADDLAFQKTIDDPAAWYPSPALFVYTLPNIVTGEIAIRHHLPTETCFMVLEEYDPDIIAEQAFLASQKGPLITGWLECTDKDHFRANVLAMLSCMGKDCIKEALELNEQ